MAENRIWTTNNINDLGRIAAAFGLPGDLQDVETATQAVNATLTDILLELRRIRFGLSLLVNEDLGHSDPPI